MIKIKKYQIEDYISDATQDALDLKADLVNGKVPASQLPSFVDDVIEVANYAALPIPGATGVIYITLDTNKVYRWTGSVYVEIGSGVTNLSYTPGVSNGTVNSDTGSDAIIPLAGTVNAGLFSAAEKSKLGGIAPNANVGVIPNAPITGATKTKITYDTKGLVTSGADATTADIADSTNKRYVTDANLTVINNTSGTNTGDQGLQSVTDIGASTTNGITITVSDGGANGITSYSSQGIGVRGESSETIAVYGTSNASTGVYGSGNTGVYAYSAGGTGIEVHGNGNVGISVNLGNSNKGLVINSGSSSTGNPIEIIKSDDVKFTINQQGEQSIVKIPGGLSTEYLMADGTTTTGGTGGGGSTVNYYLNGGTSQGTFGGTTYYEFSKTAVIGTGADFNISSNGYIASFITDVADPSLLLIPGGNWNLEFFFSASSNGGSPSFYVELYKYDGTTFTLITSSSATPEGITGGTAIDAYFTSLAVPETILTVNDRLAIRVFVNASSKTITLHTQNGHLCEVITTFTSGLTALNGLQAQVQNFAIGTTGTDFAINSSGSTHTFNLPSADATARGVVTTGTQTFAGAKTFSSQTILGNGIIGATQYGLTPQVTVGSATGGVLDIRNTNTNIVAGNTIGTLQFSAKDDDSIAYANAQIKAITQNGIGTGSSGKTDLIFYTSNGSFPTEVVKMNDLGLVINSEVSSTIASFNANKSIKSLTTEDGYPSLVELKHVKGVTSAIQTQFTGKAPLASPTFTGTVVLPSTTSIGTVSSTEIGYLDNVTSNIQDQFSGKQPLATNLTSLSGLTYSAPAFVKMTGANTFTLDTSTYLTSVGISNLTATGTPSATTYLRGDNTWSSIPVPSQSAYTVLANNTNASAVPTEQVYKDVAQQTYTATPTWSTSAPTTILANTYEWSQIGSTVNVRISLSYNTGAVNSSVILPMPADMPAPASITGFTGALDVLSYGSGMMLNATTSTAVTGARNCLLRRNAANTGYEFFVNVSITVTTKVVIVNLTYFA